MQIYKNKSLDNLSQIVERALRVEKWSIIDNSEGNYLISDFGRVKSLGRVYRHPIKGLVEVEEKILSQKLDINGYCIVQIIQNSEKVKWRVHRLVGFAFIPNPENKPQINHKKGIRTDNRVWELEWNTSAENNLHAYRVLNRKRPQSYLGKVGKLHHASKKVYCPTLQIYFESARQAAKALGLSQGSISHVCNGVRSHVDGLVFNYSL